MTRRVFLLNEHRLNPHPAHRVVWTTRRVHHQLIHRSCPWLAELYEQLVEFIFILKKIALDSPSLFMHSPSPMNFQNNGLVQNVGSLPGTPPKTFPHSTGSLWPSTDMGQNLGLIESKNGLAELVTTTHWIFDFWYITLDQKIDLCFYNRSST